MTDHYERAGSIGQEIIYESHEIEELGRNEASNAFALTDNENIIQSSLNPADAFQYFHQFKAPVPGKHYYQSSTSSTKGVESPWEKYYRLKSELEELKVNLDEMSVVHQEQKDNVWSILQEKTNTLIQEASSLSSHEALKRESNKVASTESLSVDVLKNLLNKISLKDEESSKEQVLFMIQNSISRSYSTRLLQLESKIATLESMIGSDDTQGRFSLTSNESLSAFPLSSSVQRLEEKVNLLDHSNLEQYRSKLSLLKVELEGLASSLNSPDGGSTKVVNIYNKVQSFVDQFAAVQSIVHELPLIILRLKTLENVHWNATTFVSRLDSLEKDVKVITNDLQSNQSILLELKSTLQENFAIVKENVERIERHFTES